MSRKPLVLVWFDETGHPYYKVRGGDWHVMAAHAFLGRVTTQMAVRSVVYKDNDETYETLRNVLRIASQTPEGKRMGMILDAEVGLEDKE